MSLTEEVRQILDEKLNFLQRPDQYASLQAFNEVRNLLIEEFQLGKRAYPLRYHPKNKNQEGQDAFSLATILLERRGLPAAAEALLLEWWNRTEELQRSNKIYVYKAAIANRLTDHYLLQDKIEMAFRWALYTQIDDIFGEHESGGGAGKDKLITVFGLRDRDIEYLNSVTQACRDQVTAAYANKWSVPEAFPEEVLCQIVRDREKGHILINTAAHREFPLSTTYLKVLRERAITLHKVGERVPKGKALESIAIYLSLLLPGCVPKANVEDLDKAFENDILVRNLHQAPNLSAEILGRHFLIECKNQKSPVSVQQIGYFLSRMKITHCTFGIMLTLSGMTGDRSNIRTSARSWLRRIFHEDGSICVVVNNADLGKLERGEMTFWWMLLEKIEEVRFGRPKRS